VEPPPGFPVRDEVGPEAELRGALEETTGRNSTACSREQIGQFWISRLWRQNEGTVARISAPRVGSGANLTEGRRGGAQARVAWRSR
jgi:hypothetical protein